MELMTVPMDPPSGSEGAPQPAGEPTIRTRLGSRWRERFAWPRMQVVQAPGPGGPIETWIASPADASDEPLPTIVDVHGGPLGAWAPAPSVEVVLLCGAGFRVVLPNIRGSTSYGRDWIRPHLGNWGGPDAEDVHAALDHAIALGLADPDRLGALGLSYGGFMVNWLLGHDGSLQGRHHRRRRRQPGLGLGTERLGRRLQPVGAPRSAARSRRASTRCGG